MEMSGQIFAHQGQTIYEEWPWQAGVQQGLQPGDKRLTFSLGQFAGQGDVKAEFLHHERVAPGLQQGVLCRGQAPGAALGQFGLGQRGAERVKGPHGLGRHGVEVGRIPDGSQGQKTAQLRHAEPIQGDDRLIGAERLKRRAKRAFCGCRIGPKWRFDRGVQPVLARCCRDLGNGLGQAVNLRVRHANTLNRIPPKPRGAEIGQRPRRRREIDRVSFEFHGCPRNRITACQHSVTFQ